MLLYLSVQLYSGNWFYPYYVKNGCFQVLVGIYSQCTIFYHKSYAPFHQSQLYKYSPALVTDIAPAERQVQG